MFFPLFVAKPPIVEGAHPWGKAEEVLRCPDTSGGQGHFR